MEWSPTYGRWLLKNNFTCFDAFGLGALLAWMLFFYGLVTAIVLVPVRTIVSFIALWLIAYIVLNQENDRLKINAILSNRVLIFLGEISYGIYLYHHIIPTALNLKIINRYFNPLLPDFLYKAHWLKLFVAENTILLIVISWLSYILIEKRFLNLKRQFAYEKK